MVMAVTRSISIGTKIYSEKKRKQELYAESEDGDCWTHRKRGEMYRRYSNILYTPRKGSVLFLFRYDPIVN